MGECAERNMGQCGGSKEGQVKKGSNQTQSKVPADCTDYKVVQGKLEEVKDGSGVWRLAGSTKVEFGFELTQDQDNQKGHILCRQPFTSTGHEIVCTLDYVMEPKSAAESGGQGLCIYLLDPEVEGWDSTFDGSGPLGFVGKTGAIVGVGIDCTGEFCGGQASSIGIKQASDGVMLTEPKELEGGVVTRVADYWRKVKVKFDIKDNKCDVTIGKGDKAIKIFNDISLKDLKIPNKVCIGVCAGTSNGKTNKICVNNIKLKGEDDDDEKKVYKIDANIAPAAPETGVPEGCTDYDSSSGKLVASDKEQVWRCAGHAKVGYGFELTQDEDNQKGHLLCRQPFKAKGKEIVCKLEYVLEPKSAADGGGQGLCIYLLDPSVPGWDRLFDGTGPLGFVGKTGAIVGVGIDCTGEFCKGNPSSVAIKRASDSELLCDPVDLETGVVTAKKEDYWREVKIKFDIADNKCDVTIGGVKVLDDIQFEGITIPKKVCIAVCAGTADGKTNHICINKLKLKSDDDDVKVKAKV